jgi:acyl carrier protein
MNPDHIRKLVFEAMQTVAPEIEENSVNPDEELREECDIDSIDYLIFLSELKKSSGISIPEADYSKVNTLNKILDYLDKKLN